VEEKEDEETKIEGEKEKKKAKGREQLPWIRTGQRRKQGFTVKLLCRQIQCMG
jgi:hypothetical protein